MGGSVVVRECPVAGREVLLVGSGDGAEVVGNVSEVLGLGTDHFFLVRDGRIVDENSLVPENAVVQMRLRVMGGKGGFGNMLRGQGPVKKTTNFDACRDLSGRRLRSANNERRISQWKAEQEEKEREAEAQDGEAVGGSSSRSVRKEPVFDAEDFEGKLASGAGRMADALANGLANDAKRKAETLENRKVEERKANSLLKRRKLFMDIEDDIESEEEGNLPETESDSHGMAAPPARPGSVRFEAPSTTSREPSPVVSSLAYSVSTEPVSDCGDSSYTQSEPITESVGTVDESVTGQPQLPNQGTASQPPQPETSVPSYPRIELGQYRKASELEALGLDVLKAELIHRGLKCGGRLQERAERLFSAKNLDMASIDPKLRARPSAVKRE